MRPSRRLLCLPALALLAATSGAQFDLFDWNYTPGSPDSSGSVAAADMWVDGGFNGQVGFQGFLTRAPVDGTVAFTIEHYMAFDGYCGASVPVFSENGVLTTLASCSVTNQSHTFEVAAGSEFGLGLNTTNPTFPGTVHFVQFHFIPADPVTFWTDLGQGMGGALGPPVLAGQGLLYGGMPIKLKVSNAAPHNPSTLVIGLSALNAPFKGGVMVPMPNLLIPGLLIGTGTLTLSSHWPSGLPAGLQIWTQFWIVDPTAPLGLSATNCIKAIAP